MGSESISRRPREGDRVWHKKNGWGEILEINPWSNGKPGFTAHVHWEIYRKPTDQGRGKAYSKVYLSSLSLVGPSSAGRVQHPTSKHERPLRPESDADPQGGITDSPTPAPVPALPFAFPEEVPPSGVFEGAVRTVTVNAYERNPKNRRKCIAAHGTSCCICGFRFGAVYGEIAEGYIHVHHLRPLSEVGEAHAVDPVADLRPVCPNCHAVLHLGGECRKIDEVKRMVKGNRG